MALKLGSNIDHDKIARSLGQRYKLVPHLDLAIGEGGDFKWGFDYAPKESDDAWHPSGDCTPSLHDLYLKATGRAEPWNISLALRKTFMIGHFLHQYLQWIVQHKLGFANAQAIERRGYQWWGTVMDAPHPTVPLDITPMPYHWTTGSGDIAPCVIPGHGEFGIDFKTMNARTFSTGPSPDMMGKWECQGNMYMDFFQQERILFVGICKDFPHEMKEWEFERNQDLIDAIYQKWQLVSACVDEGVEPPKNEVIHLPLKGLVKTQ